MSEKPVVIYAARTVQDAHLLQNLLAEAGIQAVVANEVLEGGSGVDIVGWPTLARVMVHEDDAGRARQMALEFDRRASEPSADEPGADAGPGVVVPWPTCPDCGARRMTQCPVCVTSGTDFPPADADDTSAKSLATASEGSPPMCGPQGCTVPCTPDNAEDAPVAPQEPLRGPMLLCPTCDEPFVPQYLRRCEWCGHDFGDGLEARAAVEVNPGLNLRVLLVIAGAAAVAVGIVAYLMLLF